MKKELSGIKAMARHIGCSERTVYRLLAAKKLPERIQKKPISIWNAADLMGLFHLKPCQNDMVNNMAIDKSDKPSGDDLN